MIAKKLSDELQHWRCERPDEWKMDEFIRGVKDLERERNELAALAERLRDVLLKCKSEFEEFQAGRMTTAYSLIKDALPETPPAALEALRAQWQAEYEHCDHQYCYFGEQRFRRCFLCDKPEIT